MLHSKIEKNIGLMAVLIAVAISFGGLAEIVPLMFEAAVPATPFVPMAITISYGVLYASIMTLFLVPVGYLIVDDLRRLSQGMARRLVAGRSAPTSDAAS